MLGWGRRKADPFAGKRIRTKILDAKGAADNICFETYPC